MQVCGVVIPADQAALQAEHDTAEIVFRVARARADIPRGIAQADCPDAERIVRVSRTEYRGTSPAACVDRAAREAPCARYAARVGLETGLLLRVARFEVSLVRRQELPGRAPEEIQRLVARRHRSELADVPEAAAARIGGGYIGEAATARKRLVK